MRAPFFVIAAAPLAAWALAACSSNDESPPPAPVLAAEPDAEAPAPDAAPETDAGDEAGAPLGKDLSSTPGGLFETENQLAIAPNGTIGVLYSTIAPGSEGMSYRFSTDDGATFSRAGAIAMPDGLYAGDPAITTDASGNFWAAFLGIHYAGQQIDYIRVYAAEAPAGSTTFSAPVEVTDPQVQKFHDHPKIYVTSKGTIVIAYMESDGLTSETAAGISATSTNGTDWTRHTLVSTSDALFSNLFSMCEGQSALYATFFEITSTTTYGIGLRKSTDEGATWSTTTSVSRVNDAPAGLDVRCAAHGSDVWVSYATTTMAPPTGNAEESLEAANAIMVAHSTDEGATFGSRTNAFDAKATALSTLPEFVREDSGALDVAYIAGDKDGDTDGSVRFTRATAGTFGPSTKIDGPLRFALKRDAETWLGDYFGLATLGNTLYVAYPQNSSGDAHVYFAKVPLP